MPQSNIGSYVRDSTLHESVLSKTQGDEYKAAENGALRKGGKPNLFSKKYLGFLMQYVCVGFVYGALPRTIYPFFNNYLRMEGYQTLAASTLINMPWSFKLVYGIISDSFPILGYRRRPYMVIGWALTLCSLILMAVMKVPEPYFAEPSFSEIPLEELDPSLINEDAPGAGAKYVVLMMIACAGYLVAVVAADGMTVEFAQREPENVRGTTQTFIYSARTLSQIGAKLLMTFGMNGGDYGGSFDWSLSLNTLSYILCVSPIIGILSALFFLEEEKIVDHVKFSDRCKEMWKLSQQRCIWQLMFYQFFNTLFYAWGATALYPMAYTWAKVEPLNDGLMAIVGNSVFLGTLVIFQKIGLNWDWRRTIAVTTIIIVILDSFIVFFTIYDVVRNQWFWLGPPILQELPSAINFIVGTLVIVEVATEGYEAATYGLLTTVANLGSPVGTVFTNLSNQPFDVSQNDLVQDTEHVRNQCTYTMLIMYGAKLFSLVFLVLLPKQKQEAQELKRSGGNSKTMGAVAVIGTVVLFCYSLMCQLFSIFPSTSCLVIAGGSGC